MEQYTSTVPQLHGRLDPVSYGSYLDAAIPFPRTSGAKFCACGEWWESNFRMTLKNASGKCYLFYQLMDEKIKTWPLRFPAKENLNMEKALFDWPIVVAVWRQSEKPRALCPFAKPIKSLYFRSFVVSALFARFHLKVIRKSLWHSIITLSLSPLIC